MHDSQGRTGGKLQFTPPKKIQRWGGAKEGSESLGWILSCSAGPKSGMGHPWSPGGGEMKPRARLHPPARQKGIRGASGLHPPTHPARGGGVSPATPRPAWVRPRRLAAGLAGRPPTGDRDRVHGADLEPEAEAGSGAQRALSGRALSCTAWPRPAEPGARCRPNSDRLEATWPPGRGGVGTGQGRARQGAGLLPPQPSPGPAFVLRSRGAGLEAAIVCAPGLHPCCPAPASKERVDRGLAG